MRFLIWFASRRHRSDLYASPSPPNTKNWKLKCVNLTLYSTYIHQHQLSVMVFMAGTCISVVGIYYRYLSPPLTQSFCRIKICLIHLCLHIW